MRTTRQRGHSFYEEDEDDDVVREGGKSAGSSPGRDGSVGSGSGVGGDDGAGLNTSRDSTESSTSGSSASLSSGDGDQEAEELNFPRGRARSRSILGPPDLSGSSGEGSGIVKYDPANPPASTGSKENKEVPQVPKSGPLAQHEIQVLKKGLEDATLTRKKEQLEEEEEERLAAATEKRDRVEHKSSTPAYTMGSESQNMRRWKILMLGDSGVGKSSLIMRWTMDQFLPSLVGTVGVNFKSKKVTIAEEAMQVQVWDTAGQEQFHKITTSYYRGAHGIMLIYDVSDRNSFSNIEYWIKNIKAHASGNVHVALVGNKTDLRQLAQEQNQAGRCIEYAQGKEVADRFSVPYFEVSAKDNSNVDSAFMTVVHSIIKGDGEPLGSGPSGDKKQAATSPASGAGAVAGAGAGAAGKDSKKGNKKCVIQ